MRALAALAGSDVANEFAYQRFRTGPYGLIADVCARARITLPPVRPGLTRTAGIYRFEIDSVNGHRFGLPMTAAP